MGLRATLTRTMRGSSEQTNTRRITIAVPAVSTRSFRFSDADKGFLAVLLGGQHEDRGEHEKGIVPIHGRIFYAQAM